jgi:hypothetical protein
MGLRLRRLRVPDSTDAETAAPKRLLLDPTFLWAAALGVPIVLGLWLAAALAFLGYI